MQKYRTKTLYLELKVAADNPDNWPEDLQSTPTEFSFSKTGYQTKAKDILFSSVLPYLLL